MDINKSTLTVKIEPKEDLEYDLHQEVKLEMESELDLPIKSLEGVKVEVHNYQQPEYIQVPITIPPIKEELCSELDLPIKSLEGVKVEVPNYQQPEYIQVPITIPPIKEELCVRNTPPLSDVISDAGKSGTMGPKLWTQEDMELALDALRNNMSLTKASSTYHIPSPTLWKRARRVGVDIPKLKIKSWTEDNLNSALGALRSGAMSANKASKAYGIPSSTLFKNAHLKGIRLTTPFNAAPTTWTQDDLEQALVAISSGQTSVQHASTEYGIPRGTLYGRCKRDGIKLSRSNVALWSEESMGEALEAVRVGQMSIKDAASHYKLPYSSLYGRLKRNKYQVELAPSSG